MSDVFLSYSRRDRALAENLAEKLRQRGVSVWRDTEIQPGEDWQVAINAGLDAARKVVLLWTNNAAQSHSVLHEAGYAAGLNKLMVAIVDGAIVPPDLSHQQYATTSSDSLLELARTIVFTLEGPTAAAISNSDTVVTAPEVKNRGFAFLSYADEDHVFVDELRAFLTAEKFLYWEYASSDREIEKMLYLELEGRLLESDVVISVVSPDWKRSRWSALEYFFAKEVGRPVFIVECRKLEPTLALAGEHRIQCWGERRSAGFELLSRELKRRGL